MSHPASPPIDLRILTFSNSSLAQTGYGVQVKHLATIAKQLGMTFAEFGFYGAEGGMQERDGHPIYPKAYTPWGDDVAAAHGAHFQADIILALLDSWVINTDFFNQSRLIFYVPIDHDPCPQQIADRLRSCWLPVMYSQYAVRKAAELGIQTAYAPHCVDTDVFQPAPRSEARAALGWPQDRPILVTVAANKGYPSRKNWPQMIRAFAEAKQRHPDVLWYCHTTTGERGEMQGINLIAEAERYGVRDAIMFPNQHQLLLGYPDHYLRAVYAAGDLFYLPSGGEGFGVPAFESLACGTPLLTTDVTAMQDITGAGVPGFYLPEEACERWSTPLVADQFIPRHYELSRLLDAALDTLSRLTEQERWQKYGGPARAFAEGYHVPVVAERYWRPIFAHAAQRIADEGRVQFAGSAQHQRDINHAASLPNAGDRYAWWLNRWSDIQAHLPTLYALGRGTVVELGSRSGMSTAALLAGVQSRGGMVYSIDVDPQCERLFSDPQWFFLCGSSTSQTTVGRLITLVNADGPFIDTLFVDTEHTRAQVEAELAAWGPWVRPGGTIAFHDVDSYPEVREAVEAFCQARGLTAIYHSGSNGLGLVQVPSQGTRLGTLTTKGVKRGKG